MIAFCLRLRALWHRPITVSSSHRPLKSLIRSLSSSVPSALKEPEPISLLLAIKAEDTHVMRSALAHHSFRLWFKQIELSSSSPATGVHHQILLFGVVISEELTMHHPRRRRCRMISPIASFHGKPSHSLAILSQANVVRYLTNA